MECNPSPITGMPLFSRLLARLALGALLLLAITSAHAATTLTYDASGNTTAQQADTVGLPVITTQPRDRLSEPGGNAGFSVNVVSDSPLTYQWQFNTVNIPGATADSLYIPTVTPAQEGSYRVVITNATGTVTSPAATLSIDTNSNGMADAWELLYFGNLTQAPGADYDGDSISNLDEYQNGTNPAVREPYYWTAASGDLNVASNWSRNRVPGVGDTAYIQSGTFTVSPNTPFTASTVTVSAPYVASSTTDTTLNLTGIWTFAGPFTLAPGRYFNVTGGGTVTVTGAATIAGASIQAASGATLSFPGITTFTLAGTDSSWWRAVGDNARLIFPNLTTITGTPSPGRWFDIETYYSSTARVSLPALTTITKTDDGDNYDNSGIRFYARDGGTISAPLLTAFNDNDSHPASSLNAYGTGAVLVPALFAPKGVNISLTAASDPGHFTSLQNATLLEITSGTATMNNLTSIAGLLVIRANGGATLSLPNVTTYVPNGNGDVNWQAFGDGSRLIFPNLISITGTPAAGRWFNIEARYSATAQVSLPVLTTITKTDDGDNYDNSGIRFFAYDGSTISAPLLNSFNDNDSHPASALNAYGSSAILVPALFAPKGVNISLTAASDPGHFVSLQNATLLEITSGTATMNNLTSIAGLLVIRANGGATLSLPNVTTYVPNGNGDVNWQAFGDGSRLIFPNLISITGTPAAGRWFNIEARYSATAQVSLPVLTTITKTDDGDNYNNSGIRFFAYDGSTISAPLLNSFNDNDSHPASSLNAFGNSTILVSVLRLSGTRGVALNGVSLPADAPVLTSGSTATAVLGNLFLYQITANNFPTSFAAANLPAALTVDTTSGLISGTPAGAGTFVATVSATNAIGTDSKTLTITLTSPTSTPAPAGIVAWWPGEDSALDLIGTNDGAPTNGAAYAAGKVGRAFSFDGADDRIAIPESTATDISRKAAWTIEAWVRPTSFINQQWPTIYSEGRWGASLGLNNGSGKPESWINNSNQLVGTIALQLNAWNQVALTYDGTNRKFYVNGIFAGSGSAPEVGADDSGAAIGDVAYSSNSGRFSGQIDEVSLYTRALAANEITAIYNAGIAGKQIPGTSPTFATWKASQFTVSEQANAAISGPSADPDGDGLPNLLEYALNLNPKLADSTGQVPLAISGGNLTLRYAKARADVTYSVQTSTDLGSPASWTTTGVTQGTPDTNGNVTASVPLDATRRFLRLQVTVAP